MTDIVVLGQPYWATRIAHALDDPRHDVSAQVVTQRAYATRLLGGSSAPQILLRAGYRVGGTTRRGRAFDAYWTLLRRRFPRARAVHYWLGTDVLNTLQEASVGTLRQAAVAAARADLHLADAPWLTDELATVGLTAETAPVPQDYRAPSLGPPLPDAYTVTTYLPADRFDFYGGDALVEAARRLPNVAFQVVGSLGSAGAQAPSNMTFLGWVDDMEAVYRRTTVLVRVPCHDGLGATVIEALLLGRHVVYTHMLPSVHQVWPVTPEALVDVLGDLEAEHVSGHLEVNEAGRAYAAAAFDPAALTKRVRELVLGAP